MFKVLDSMKLERFTSATQQYTIFCDEAVVFLEIMLSS